MTGAVNDVTDGCSDATLIDAVRRGEVAAYGVLYERHIGAARRAAAGLVPARAEQEDLVAEAFTRVLRVLRTGAGPMDGFRPYLLATMRNAVISWGRRPAPAPVAEIPDGCLPPEREDPVDTRVHATVAADAFASLPERWRMVLWHTEVEGESPAEIAPLLGMTPNGVAALAYRARNGLRRAYLEQYLPAIEHQVCRGIVEQLVGWVKNRFGARKMRRIAAHLDRCADCSRVAAGLRQVNNELPVMVAPIILGAPLAAVYLSTGAMVSSGAAFAAAGSTAVSTVAWLTTAKTIVAGAAIVTTAAVSTVASDPAPPSIGSDNGTAVSVPAGQPPKTGHRGPDRVGSTRQGPPLTSLPTAPSPAHGAESVAPTETGQTKTPAETARDGTKEAKQDKKATKQTGKAVKQDAKQSAKNAEKEDNKEATPVMPKKPKNVR